MYFSSRFENSLSDAILRVNLSFSLLCSFSKLIFLFRFTYHVIHWFRGLYNNGRSTFKEWMIIRLIKNCFIGSTKQDWSWLVQIGIIRFLWYNRRIIIHWWNIIRCLLRMDIRDIARCLKSKWNWRGINKNLRLNIGMIGYARSNRISQRNNRSWNALNASFARRSPSLLYKLHALAIKDLNSK